jgi:trimethylamine-N-oxide reductase (cytochrome c), cytochrome c-type subunit TorC
MAADGGDDLLGGGDDLIAPAAGGPHAAVAGIEQPFHGGGTAVDWAVRTTTVLALAMIAAALASLVLGRRERRSSVLGVVRILGLFACPLFLFPLGNFATFETSKRVEFCETCHTAMDPYVQDMRSPESRTLAARHFANRYIQNDQCFACHADYGLFGEAKAKVRGLRHVYYWITDTPEARGEEQIHHYGPYQNSLCLTCHAGSKRFLEAKNGVHRDVAGELAARDPATGKPVRACLQCHGPAHPTLAQWKVRGTAAPVTDE